MSENRIKALRYEVQEVGKHIKSSKKRFLWVITIGERIYNFVLDDSVVSGKSKLSINGKIFHQIEQAGLSRCKYNHSFIVDGCLFNLIELDGNYEMRINNNLFSHLLSQSMKRASFTDHVVEDTSFELDQKFKQKESKKITMNLPGMINKMKKKTAVQSDNWGCFAGSVNEFSKDLAATEAKKQDIAITKKPSNQVSQDIQSVVRNEPFQPFKCPQPILLTEQKFSTLKNVFETINASGTYVGKATESTPTYEVEQIPVIPEINLMQFNTMQDLFRTNHVQMIQAKTAHLQAKFDNFSFIAKESKPQVEKPKFQCFNTMQNMFNTSKSQLDRQKKQNIFWQF